MGSSRRSPRHPPSTQLATQAITAPNEPINLVGPPETVLYRLFFNVTNSLEKKAAELGDADPSAAVLLDYYVDQAGLTQAENNEVFQVAADYAAAIAPIRAQINALVSAYHQARLAYSISQGGKPVDPAPQLHQLAIERATDAMTARLQLQSELGPDGFYKLEVYVHRVYGRARRIDLSPPPGPSNPGSTGGAQ